MRDVVYSVDFDQSTTQFTFTCEVKRNSIVIPASFSLMFQHPAQFEPSKIGFDTTTYHGSDVYTSESIGCGNNVLQNTYMLSEISHQKRFQIQNNVTPAHKWFNPRL